MNSNFIKFFPIIAITLAGILFPVSKNKVKPVFQPPDWVFGLIWPIITLTLGFITNLYLESSKIKINRKNNILKIYFLIIICLVSWLYLNYNHLVKQSFYLLVFTAYISIVFLIYLVSSNDNRIKKYVWFLLPMPFWLVLASCLNAVIYNNKLTSS